MLLLQHNRRHAAILHAAVLHEAAHAQEISQEYSQYHDGIHHLLYMANITI